MPRDHRTYDGRREAALKQLQRIRDDPVLQEKARNAVNIARSERLKRRLSAEAQFIERRLSEILRSTHAG